MSEQLSRFEARDHQVELPAGARIDCAAEMLEDLCFANLRRAFAGTERPETLDISALSERLSVQINLVVAGLKAT